MANVTNFTPEELNQIREIIPLTGFAVAVAGNSGIIGTFKEAAATARGLSEAAAKYPQNELIQSLLKDLSQNRPTMPKYNPLEAGVQEKIKTDALEKTRQVVTVLSQKAPPQEVNEFKQWILAVSESVANAAKEGAFLGIGGERVSAAEKAMLTDLQGVLSV